MIKIKAQPTSTKTLRHGITVRAGLGSPDEISDEIQEMYNVLLDRVRAPISPDSTNALLEIADAYYMRATELSFKIHRLERLGDIDGSRSSKDPYHLLRTGEIADFLDGCKRTAETGSRRLSAMQLEFQQAELGRATA